MRGQDVMIYVEQALQFVPVAGQRDVTVNRDTAVIDRTTKTSGEWLEKRPGHNSWSVDCSGLIPVDIDGYNLLKAAWRSKTLVKVQIKNSADETATIESGMAIITSFPETHPYADDSTYSIKLDGTGPLVEE